MLKPQKQTKQTNKEQKQMMNPCSLDIKLNRQIQKQVNKHVKKGKNNVNIEIIQKHKHKKTKSCLI